jgi:hypothetical protein
MPRMAPTRKHQGKIGYSLNMFRTPNAPGRQHTLLPSETRRTYRIVQHWCSRRLRLRRPENVSGRSTGRRGMRATRKSLLVVPGAQRSPVEVPNHPIQHGDKQETVDEHRDHLRSEHMSELLIGYIVIRLTLEIRRESLHDDLSYRSQQELWG